MKNQFFVIVDRDESDKFRQFNYNTYEKLLEKLGYSNSRFWAFPENEKEGFDKVKIDDEIYFAIQGDHTFSFSAKVSGKEENSNLAEKVFGEGFRQKITKSVLFFNEFFVTSINYTEMLRSTGQEAVDKPGLYLIQNKFEETKIKSNEPKEIRDVFIPVDHAGPPPKIQATTTRYIRDTVKTRLLKMKYENKCQICNYQIIKPNNEYYSEVHHIWPLQNGGDDDFDNMLVLCPTHHAEFDYNVIRISKDGKNIIDNNENVLKELTYIDEHKTSQKNIDQQFRENIE
tara:strand:- start:5652 stop:6509 length:858 start_codon:yes stop_codon:yes gene_type:complete